MITVDWLTAYQVDPYGKLPVFGEDLVLKYNIETGEQTARWVSGYQHEGSFDSSLRIKSDGMRLEVSGNPSHWNQEEAVYGVETVPEAIDVYNEVLGGLGLPSLQMSERTEIPIMRSVHPLREGARITRVDLTQNYACGRGNVVPLIRGLSSQVYRAKPGSLYPNGRTVSWGEGSHRWMFKYYDKGYELGKKPKTEPMIQLTEWANDMGIVRHELTLKAKELSELGLNRMGEWNRTVMSEKMAQYATHDRTSQGVSDFEHVSEWLQAHGYAPSYAENAQQKLLAWLAGRDVWSKMSRATAYRYRNMLLAAVGVDIRNPCDVSKITIRVREIKMQAIVPPVWYRNDVKLA